MEARNTTIHIDSEVATRLRGTTVAEKERI
jgi:hypothetical protein